MKQQLAFGQDEYARARIRGKVRYAENGGSKVEQAPASPPARAQASLELEG